MAGFLAACAVWLGFLLRPATPALVLLLLAAIGVAAAAPLLLDGYFGGGVANLPVEVFAGALIARALIAPPLATHPVRAVMPGSCHRRGPVIIPDDPAG